MAAGDSTYDTSFSTVRSELETAQRCDGTNRLSGHGSDLIEIAVVMADDEAGALRGRANEQVGDLDLTMASPGDQLTPYLRRAAPHVVVDGKLRKRREIDEQLVEIL
jgi:hypothetical protein